MLVLGLGPDVIPDRTPVTFFGFDNPHGTAGQARSLMDRYGSPFDATLRPPIRISSISASPEPESVASARTAGAERSTSPLKIKPTSFGEAQLGLPVPRVPPPTPGPFQYRLWSSKPFTVEMRRYGDHWVRLADAPANHNVFLTLPVLATEGPYEIKANGACLAPYVPLPPK